LPLDLIRRELRAPLDQRASRLEEQLRADAEIASISPKKKADHTLALAEGCYEFAKRDHEEAFARRLAHQQ